MIDSNKTHNVGNKPKSQLKSEVGINKNNKLCF